MSIPHRPMARLSYTCLLAYWEASKTRWFGLRCNSGGIRSGLVFVLVMILLFSFEPCLYASEKALSGEEKARFFYVITHLHPMAYVILFGVLILSVSNLFFQGRLHSFLISTNFIGDTPGTMAPRYNLESLSVENSLSLGKQSKPLIYDENSSISAAIPVVQAPTVSSSRLTPLDGVNHPLPNWSGTKNSNVRSRSDLSGNTHHGGKKNLSKLAAYVDLMQIGCVFLSEKSPLITGVTSCDEADLLEVLPDYQLCMECLGYGGNSGKHDLVNIKGGLIMAGKKKQPTTRQTKKPKSETAATVDTQMAVTAPEMPISKELSARISHVDALINAGQTGELKGRVPEIRKEHHCQWGKLLEEDIALRQQILTLKEKENALLTMIRDRVADNVMETADQAVEQGLLKQPES